MAKERGQRRRGEEDPTYEDVNPTFDESPSLEAGASTTLSELVKIVSRMDKRLLRLETKLGTNNGLLEDMLYRLTDANAMRVILVFVFVILQVLIYLFTGMVLPNNIGHPLHSMGGTP